MTLEQMKTALRNGKFGQLDGLVRNAWADLSETFQLCQALGELEAESKKKPRNWRRQKDGMHDRLIRSMERMSPETLIRIGGYYYDLITQQQRVPGLNLMLLCSGAHDYNRAVQLITTFNQARARLYGQWAGPSANHKAYEQYMGLHYFFGVLLTHLDTRTWENFIAAVLNGDKRAYRTFCHLLVFWGLGDPTITFVEYKAYAQRPAVVTGDDILNAFLDQQRAGVEIRVPVPAGAGEKLLEIRDQFEIENEKQQKPEVNLCEWFLSHEEMFQRRKRQMWLELSEAPRYGLRPNGLDKVRLNIDELRNLHTAYKAVQFFPVELFPNVQVRFLVEFLGQPTTVDFILDNPDAFSTRERLYAPGDPRAVMRRLLEYIAIDCYWRILTGNPQVPMPFVREMQRMAPAGSISRSARAPGFCHLQIVRPRFRRLPTGRHASSEAIQRAIDHPRFGYAPPEGMTFVRQHNRGYGDIADAEPLFNYTLDDIGYMSALTDQG